MDRGVAVAGVRPVRRSEAPQVEVARITNVTVEYTALLGCGARTPQSLVVCLDADGRLAPEDELALLARVSRTAHAEVGSPLARAALLDAATTAGLALPVKPEIRSFASCQGDCDRRIVLRSAP